MNGKAKVWAFALLLGSLLAGGVVGAAVDRRFVADRACSSRDARREDGRDRREHYLEWLSRELELTAEQRGEIEVTVDAYRQAVSGLWRDMRPQFERLKAELREDIRAVLTDEQRVRYEALLEGEAERRRGEHGGSKKR